jgi:subtilisin-like proprotein convertase family protein
VTFLASSGDNGTPAGWPAISANVVAVGGTTLSLSATDTRVSETGWNGSGGGTSSFISEPSYQSTYAGSSYVQSTLGNKVLLGSNRGNPDVAYAADPNPGFAVSDTYPFVQGFQTFTGPWYAVGGTSDAAPQWAGLIALVDQARGSNGSLNGPTQTLPLLYKLGASSTAYPSDFFDITSGNNGASAVAGYDLVTGLGSPNAAKLVPALAGQSSVQGVTQFSITGVPSSSTAGQSFTITVTALDANGHTVPGYTGTVVFSSTDSQAVLPGSYQFSSTTDAGQHTFTGVILKTAGKETISVSDKSNALVAGTSSTDTVNPAGVSSLTVSGFPSPASVGVAGTFTVTAKDAYGNTATGYLGTVSFSSSDLKAKLPGSYTFLSTDKGTHKFTATFNTTGTQSLTAKDTAGHTASQTGIQVTSKLQFNSADTPGPIVGGYISISSISIGQNVTVADMNIKVNISYPYDSDLYIHLVSPTGVNVDLSDFEGGFGSNFQNTIFDSQAATPISSGSAPFAGSYQPEMTLNVFNGENAKGTWELWVEDWGFDNGTLNSWSIIITPSNSAPTGPAVVMGNSGSSTPGNDPSSGGAAASTTPGADMPALPNTLAFTHPAAVNPMSVIVSVPAPTGAAAPAALLLPGTTSNQPVAFPTRLPGQGEAVFSRTGSESLGDDDGTAVAAGQVRDEGRPEGQSPAGEQNTVPAAAAVSSDPSAAAARAGNQPSWGRVTEAYFTSAERQEEQGGQETGWLSLPLGLASSAVSSANGKVWLALLLGTCLGRRNSEEEEVRKRRLLMGR